MAKTRADLVIKALDLLGVSAVGQDPAAEDYAKVDGNVDTTLASLAALEIVYVPDANSIPLETFKQVAAVLAEECKTEFGLDPNEVQKLEGDRAQAESELRAIVRGRPTYEPQKAQYF